MKPPLESINLAYFVPGIVALTSSYVALKNSWGGAAVESQLEGLGYVGGGGVFLGFAYLVGYALWGVGDRLFRGRSDRLMYLWAIYYLGSSRPLRNYLLLNLYEAGHKEIARKVARATGVESRKLDSVEEQVRSPDCNLTCHNLIFEIFKKCVSRARRLRRLRRLRGRRIRRTLCVTAPREGNKLRRFCWDAIYNRANQYHVARMLSDWSNVKFAKSVCVSCVLSGLLLLLRLLGEHLFSSPPVNSSQPVSSSQPVDCWIYFWEVFGFAFAAFVFFLVARWRIRVFARGFVHGLMPYSPHGL